MELFNAKTRVPEVIDDADALNEAIVTGSHGFERGKEIEVISPDGTKGTVPSDNIVAAIQQGYRVLTPTQVQVDQYVDENKGLKGSAKVFLGQFADESLVGLPELIYDKTQSPLEVAKKEALKKEHDLANTLGGVGGFAASMVTGAPLWKGASKAGEKVAAHLAEKMAASAGEEIGKRSINKMAKDIVARSAGTATEGAIVSAPYAITEAALGDPDEAAQSLLGGVGIGALFGAGTGLGKEMLGLGSKVANNAAKLVGETDASIKTIAKKAAKVFTGVNEADLEYYIKNSEKVNAAPTLEDLYNNISSKYSKFQDDVDVLTQALNNTDQELRMAYSNARRDLAQVRPPQALADDIVVALDREKSVLGQMSEQADEALAKIEGVVEKKQLTNFLNEIKSNVGAGPSKALIGDEAVAAVNKIDNLITRIDTGLDDQIDYVTLRDVMRQVRQDIKWNQLAGEFNDTANRLKKNFTEGVSSLIKNKSPEYEQIMDVMRQRSQALEKMSKAFGDRERSASNLNKLLKPGAEVKDELLSEFSALTGQDFVSEVNRLKASKELLEKSAREDISAELVPGLFQQKKDLQKQLEMARARFEPIRRLSNMTPEKIGRRLSVLDRRSLEALEKETGEQLLEKIRDRHVLDAFAKESTQGTRKSFFNAMVASSVGSLTGFTFGGPVGAALGAVGGATLDVYGGKILKSLVDKSPNVSGLLFVEKAIKKTADKIDDIPNVLERMGKNKRNKIQTLSIDALWRVFNPNDQQPEKRKRREASDQLQKISDKLSVVMQTPEAMGQEISKLTDGLTNGGAPAIAQGFTANASRTVSYLFNALPKPPAPKSPFQKPMAWKPPDYEVNAFAQKVEIADNPLSVLDHLENGSLTKNHIDALRNMYPGLYRAIQSKFIDVAMSGKANPLPYQQRLKLSLLLDTAFDESLNPKKIVDLQRTFTSEEALAEGINNEGNEASFKAKVNVANSQKTGLQSIMSKRS